jgi:SAM-dependent methyltransferase
MVPDRHRHVHLDEADWSASADRTELEGEVLLAFVTDAATEVRALRGHDAGPVRRILDIGSGPGVGTCEFARIFPEAEVIAVDSSPAMLERVTRRASRLDLGDRVRTHLAELPDRLADLGPADVIWASMALHHVGDEVAALRALGAVLAPDGLLAIAELGDPMRVLPDNLDVGRPGLADRLDRAGATWFAALRDGLPSAVPSADLPSMVNQAGLEVLVAHPATERLDAPISADALHVALGSLRRSRERFASDLDDDDLATLDVLTDPDDPRSLQRRPDVFIVASRQIVIARAGAAAAATGS